VLDQEDQEPSTMSDNQNDSMDDDLPKAPTDATEIQQQQKIHISLRKARNSDSQPTLKLFKSFAHSLRQSDPTLALLPINATKQNLPA